MNERIRARAVLFQAAGISTPEWRTAHTTDGTDEPTGIAPVCHDADHERDDSSVYSCCAEPIIECDSGAIAAYLVRLLNADRGAS